MRRASHEPRFTSYDMKKAFSFVELMIVVAILGILAAIILPEFQSYTTQAKEAAAKDNLRILRGAIELYAARHRGIAPGYPSNDPSQQPSWIALRSQLVDIGYFPSNLPRNPFNEETFMRVIANNEDFPTEPLLTGLYGWIYKPATKKIRLNWSGTDKDGIRYYDY